MGCLSPRGMCVKTSNRIRLTRMFLLFRLAEGLVFVGLLKDIKGLLLLSLIGDEALAVEVVL